MRGAYKFRMDALGLGWSALQMRCVFCIRDVQSVGSALGLVSDEKILLFWVGFKKGIPP